MPTRTLASVILVCVLSSITGSASPQSKPVFRNPGFDFGQVIRGTLVEHTFVMKNDGTQPLRVGTLRMSPALTLTRGAARIAPGAEGAFHFRLDTSKVRGTFDGLIVISFGAALPVAELNFKGVVVPPLEASPPAAFIAVDRGHVQEQTVDIRIHEANPVRIEKIDYAGHRAAVALETVEDGRRYRLKLTIKGEGAGGKTTEMIRLTTSSRHMPVLQVPINTYIRERVYTFPDAVDMGALPASLVKNPALLRRVAQTLMIYRKGTTGFEVTATSDIPSLSLKGERAAAGDRWQFTVSLMEDRLPVGPIRGSIVIETNDPEFPRLTVPVSGQILGR